MSDPTPDRSILHQLAQDARVIRGARMLPPEGTRLTAEQIAGVARDFKRFCAEHRISLSRIARTLGTGYSESVLSQFGNGHYRGDVEAVARAVNAYMAQHARRAEAVPLPGFVETEVAKLILQTIQLAVDNSSMAEIIGPAGVGKTMTARAAEKMIAGAIYLRLNAANCRGPAMVNQLGSRIGLTSRTTFANALLRLCEQLQGSNRPILIDEAHRATMAALEAIRDIHDETGCPVVLFGTIDLQRKTNDRSMFYGQFGSRIIATFNVTEDAASSGSGTNGGGKRGRGKRYLCTVEDIVRVFSQQQVRLTDDGAEFLCAIAGIHGAGGLRLCQQLVKVAARHRDFIGKALPASILRAVLRQLHDAGHIELMQTGAERLRIEVNLAAAAAG